MGGVVDPVVWHGWSQEWGRFRHEDEQFFLRCGSPRLIQPLPCFACPPPSLCFFSLLSPCVLPFGFSHFIPSLVLFSPPLSRSLSLHVSNFCSPSAAQGLFSFQMRAKKSCDKVMGVCVWKSGPGLTVMQPRRVSVFILLFILMKHVHKLYIYIYINIDFPRII